MSDNSQDTVEVDGIESSMELPADDVLATAAEVDSHDEIPVRVNDVVIVGDGHTDADVHVLDTDAQEQCRYVDLTDLQAAAEAATQEDFVSYVENIERLGAVNSVVAAEDADAPSYGGDAYVRYSFLGKDEVIGLEQDDGVEFGRVDAIDDLVYLGLFDARSE